MASRDKLPATAVEYTKAHERMDIPGFMKMCTPDCRHRHAPASVPMPDMDNSQYEAMHHQVFPQFQSYEAEILDSVTDTTACKVVLFLNASAETNVGPYRNEYIITLTMTEDGKQVMDEHGFIDSHTMIEWTKKMPVEQPHR